MDPQSNQTNESSKDSLEGPTKSVEITAPLNDTLEGTPATVTPVTQKSAAPHLGDRLKSFIHRFNIYLLLFMMLLVIAVVLVVVVGLNQRNQSTAKVESQTLSSDALKQIANTDTTVGDPKQNLSIQSNTIFAGKVLIRQGLEVAGPITGSGSLAVSSIAVSDGGVFEDLQTNSVSVINNATIQGQLSVQKSLSVNGSGSFSGAVTAPTVNTANLQLTGDFTTTKHFTAGGTTPSKVDGNALGSGGTSSLSGSDTAGSISINTGNGPAAGCFITVTFAQRFNGIPKIMLTPIGSEAATIDYYVNRTSSNFSVCTTNPASASKTFGFDYFIVG